MRSSTLGAKIATSFGAVVLLVVSGGLFTASAAPVATPSVLTTIVPCRLLDTRSDASSLGTGVTRTQAVTGTNGDCVIPPDAIGAVMNVTIVNPTASSFLTVWPADQPKPTASSLNWVAGQPPTPNAVTAALSATGAISIFNLQGRVDVIVDVTGYYTPATTGSGPAGPPGAPGPAGPPGKDGVSGSSNRISNAQIALLKWYQDPAKAGTFPTAGNRPLGGAFDGTNIWIANSLSDSASKMNPATGTMTQTALPTGSIPFEVAFDGTNIWVTDNGIGKVSKITAATGVKVGDFNTSTIAPIAGSGPLGVAFDGTDLWVANSVTGTVSRMNPSTGAIIAEFHTSTVADSGPTGVAFDGTNVWVTNNTVGTVSKIDRGTNTPTEFPTNPTTGQPWGIAFDGTSIWVANDGPDDVAKIDPATGNILARFSTGGNLPQEVAFDGAHVWVSNFSSANVSKIDPATLVANTVATGTNPQGVVFDGTNVWVVNSGSSSISRLLP